MRSSLCGHLQASSAQTHTEIDIHRKTNKSFLKHFPHVYKRLHVCLCTLPVSALGGQERMPGPVRPHGTGH